MLKNLGNRVRSLRRAKGITLVEVSRRTGVAQATLSRIETGTMIGTIESHEKIAEALGIGLAELYAGLDSRYETIGHQKTSERRTVSHLGKDMRLELLTTESSRKKITPFLMTLAPSGQTAEEQNERGVEKFFYILKGQVSVHLDQETFAMQEGETLYFDASLSHQVTNTGQDEARILAAVSPSRL